MSDIYLSLTETPSVVTLSQPVVSGVLSSNVTVTNVVSVNVVTMPAITVQAAAPAVTTVAGTVSISNFPSTQTVAGTVTAMGYNYDELLNDIVPIRNGPNDERYIPIGPSLNNAGDSIDIPISGTVTANLPLGNSYVYLVNGDNDFVVGASNPIPVTGSVSVGNISADGGQTFEGFLSVKVDPDYYQTGLDRITPEVTVTNLVNTGNFTTRFGTPATANTVFATSAVTNGQRKYLLIQNVTTGSNVITVGIGFTPTTTRGIQLTAGAGITFESSYIPIGAVYVLSSVTASNFTILEA